MKSLFTMHEPQQCAGVSPLWRLARREACTLAAAAQPRWLRVVEGELWLTRTARDGRNASADCWLRAGERVELPAGAEVVVEGWEDSRFELLLARPVPARVRRPRATGQGVAGGLRPLPG